MPDQDPQIPLRERELFATARAHVIPRAPLVVLTHGMTSGIDGDFEKNLERELNAAGFSTLLFNSYDDREETRSLVDMSLHDHIQDLDDVIAWAKATYAPERLILAGHSLGGLVALLRGDAGIDGLVLCDPSRGPGLAKELITHGVLDSDRYHCHWDEEDAQAVVHRSLVEEMEVADGEAAATRLTVPVLVLSAGRGVLVETGSQYATWARGRQQILENSEHPFLKPGDARLIAGAVTDFAKGLPSVSLDR